MNSEHLISISDGFSAFVYGYPSSCPRAHCTPNKVQLLCVTPAGMDLYIQAMPVGTYWVQSPGFLKIVYSPPVFYTSFVDTNHYARQQQCLATKVLGVHDIHWKFYFLHFSFACSSSCHNSLISLCLMEIKDLCWSENKLLKHVAILWQCVALISPMVRTVYICTDMVKIEKVEINTAWFHGHQ